ncbi:Protein BTG2 [Eufriesea mexicana]|uniref:Protein BTG2 n=1 Tax=Eufriesea mexicana TaxID=516756 RepID=A0A310STD0_9HYME|nr:Protein BTG2 [Eufriesea mexicana]
MRLEIVSAADFLVHLLRLQTGQLSERQLEMFKSSLTEVLRHRYRDHWFPDRPNRGSGYRCIRINGKMDPVIAQAGANVGLLPTVLHSLFPSELTMWIDPSERRWVGNAEFIERDTVFTKPGAQERQEIEPERRELQDRFDRSGEKRFSGTGRADPFFLLRVEINSRRKGLNPIGKKRRRGSTTRSGTLLRFLGSGHGDVGQIRETVSREEERTAACEMTNYCGVVEEEPQKVVRGAAGRGTADWAAVVRVGGGRR